MRCLRCQQDNPPGSNFCLGCGTRLGMTCVLCGAALVAAARFCHKCGISLEAPAPDPRFSSPASYTPKHLAERILTSKAALEGERKHVTVLFADVKGSMELAEQVDASRSAGQLSAEVQVPVSRGMSRAPAPGTAVPFPKGHVGGIRPRAMSTTRVSMLTSLNSDAI